MSTKKGIFYQLKERPNLGNAALFKRATALTLLKESNSCQYLREWIQREGKQDQVYFIYKDNVIECEKWVWSVQRQWHTTAFKQVFVNRHIIHSRKGSDYYNPNLNK